MYKKKQTSLSKRLLKCKSDLSLPKCAQQPKKAIRQISGLSLIKQTPVQQCKPTKINVNFNMGPHHVCQQINPIQNDDDEFCFDVDLGVPYVESRHMDSGYQFDQKWEDCFPKVSSAKQIFTSVLDISEMKDNQLEEENFTDQEDEEEEFSEQSSKNISFKTKSRKQVPILIAKIQPQKCDIKEKTISPRNQPLSVIIDDMFPKNQSKQSFVQKLKMTAQFRQQKLKFWNSKLTEMANSNQSMKINDQNISSMNQENCHKIYYGQKSNIFNVEMQKCSLDQVAKKQIRKSKFQKQPKSKKTLNSINIEKIRNKQNIGPVGQKMEVKIVNRPSKIENEKPGMIQKLKTQMQKQQNCNRLSHRNNINKKRQTLLRNQIKSHSKDKDCVRKLF